ncbi:hypothetical protein Taro_018025 [Colocasia esculenta]|uniref:Uncharacterized protein n=1 Tax=Colocasia esculenta TaxID=4460 RepID=A0A843UV12_COLES|nr:hypothetical protein [Colocasia esculenta]
MWSTLRLDQCLQGEEERCLGFQRRAGGGEDVGVELVLLVLSVWMGGTSLADPVAALLATCGGDTVKLFDLTVEAGDPCVLSYTPTTGSHVNSVKWNHTNLVVASAGEDKKIFLWRKNGENIGTVPLGGNDAGDNISVSIFLLLKGKCSYSFNQVLELLNISLRLGGFTIRETVIACPVCNLVPCQALLLASAQQRTMPVHWLAIGSAGRAPHGESISAISFSNKGSRYLCSGGSSHIVRIWDLQRKRCIKWLSGHTDTVTGVMYNCKDEHLASISLKGDIILHNLASGARAAELKDPNGQVLRVLDYSRLSRHILVTAGDDGSLHLWDTTARSPKVMDWSRMVPVPWLVPVKNQPPEPDRFWPILTQFTLFQTSRFSKPGDAPLPFFLFNIPGHCLAMKGLQLACHTFACSHLLVHTLVSWLKQHSAPTTGVCFSPSSDKITASVGLDKKLYTYDSGNRRPVSCSPHEAPFSSLAFRDDGLILAAGTNTGRVVFYDVRGKPQPLTVLRAYSNSEAVTSLCWQRSKPVVVSENCTSEIALLGGTGEDSVLMPDPLPSTSSSLSGMGATFSRGSSTATTSGSVSTASHVSAAEETPLRSQLWPGGSLSRLQAPRNNFSLKDDMDVFSPLVDVQPITPSLGNWWDEHDETKRDGLAGEKKSTLFHSTTRRFAPSEGNSDVHPISDWRSEPLSAQEDAPSTVSSQLSDTLVASSRSEFSSTTTTEALGGSVLPEKLTSRRQPVSLSRFLPTGSLPSGSVFAGLQDSSVPSGYSTKSSLAGPGFSSSNLQSNASGTSESSSAFHLSSVSTSLGTKTQAGQTNLDIPGTLSSVLPRRFSTYSERISTIIGDGPSSAVGSPKSKKTGAETREELINTLLSRHDSSSSAGTVSLPAINVGVAQSQSQTGTAHSADQLQGASSFSLQLVQRTLEESLGSVQMSIHEDVRNLHIELLRQFHMQEMEMTSLMSSVLEKLDDLQKEVQFLRKENQQLRMLL